MSLGVEFLVRTGVIKSLFEMPCNLFVENTNKRMGKVILLKEALDHPDFCTATIYHLDAVDVDSQLPVSESHTLPLEKIFEHEKVILSGYKPIPYCGQSINTSQNVYNSPMEESEYTYYIANYLCSERHKVTKADWLWHAFLKLQLPTIVMPFWNYMDFWNRRLKTEKEQNIVKNKYKPYWLKWAIWRNELIKDEVVPSELVFKEAYDKITSVASSSSSS
jgi:hypothetical protein